MNPPKALIYCRAACAAPGTTEQISAQEQYCRAHAQEQGYDIDKVFSDVGHSGRNSNRPAFKALLDYITQHPAQHFVILVGTPSRLARSIEKQMIARKTLQNLSAHLVCASCDSLVRIRIRHT